MMKASWPILVASLTTLSLDVPLEEIHLVLLSHITLLHLEYFSIFLHISLPTSEPNGLIWKTLLPFLINHGLTLRLLKLNALDKVDMSSILTGLQHMPCLNTLYIYLPSFSDLGVDKPCRPPPVPRDSSIATSASHVRFCGAILFLWDNWWIF